MTNHRVTKTALTAVAAALSFALAPQAAMACACGCSVFDVGASSVFPTESEHGLYVWARYAYMDQNKNWEGSSSAPASDNGDKEIKTSFYFVGAQYMINHDWGVMAELPYFNRSLTTTDSGNVQGPAGSIYTAHDNAIGDLTIQGMYTGFSGDRSTGITFGVKLPTGDYTGPIGSLGSPQFDRDSLPGTGSTDLVLGGYHVGQIDAQGRWNYFMQGRYQYAVETRGNYRPGDMLDVAVGVSYDFGQMGSLQRVAPALTFISSNRSADSGLNADTLNSGYNRVLIAPGIDLRFDKLRVYADVEFPIYQRTNAASDVTIEGTSGQLVASKLFKLQVGYSF